MKIVIDSNIIFSAILNTKGKIGQIIINGSKYFDFYTVGLLRDEIVKHKNKIIKLTGFSNDQFTDSYQLITNKLVFVDDILLSDHDLKKAVDLVTGVDSDDALFVALANHLMANLWTGDKQLMIGLKKKGYIRIINTNELYDLFLEKQLKFKQMK